MSGRRGSECELEGARGVRRGAGCHPVVLIAAALRHDPRHVLHEPEIHLFRCPGSGFREGRFGCRVSDSGVGFFEVAQRATGFGVQTCMNWALELAAGHHACLLLMRPRPSPAPGAAPPLIVEYTVRCSGALYTTVKGHGSPRRGCLHSSRASISSSVKVRGHTCFRVEGFVGGRAADPGLSVEGFGFHEGVRPRVCGGAVSV